MRLNIALSYTKKISSIINPWKRVDETVHENKIPFKGTCFSHNYSKSLLTFLDTAFKVRLNSLIQTLPEQAKSYFTTVYISTHITIL